MSRVGTPEQRCSPPRRSEKKLVLRRARKPRPFLLGALQTGVSSGLCGGVRTERGGQQGVKRESAGGSGGQVLLTFPP